MIVNEGGNNKMSDVDESVLSLLQDMGIDIGDEQSKKIREKLKRIKNYVPKVGVLGKTGAGKSSLCNALFGRKIAEISDIEACTREPQSIFLSSSDEGGKGLHLVDLPGVGESNERDREYRDLYNKLLPEFDLTLWVIKSDDRALSVDEDFYKTCVSPAIGPCPIVFVLNQVDKIEPHKEWDEYNHKPSAKQLENIRKKAEVVAKSFCIQSNDICAVSASEKFGLVGLVDHIVKVLPNEKKFAFVREVQEDTVSDGAVKKAKRGIIDSILEFVDKAFKFYDKHKVKIDLIATAIGKWWLNRK